MNELLQKHGCSKVFNIPDGLRELMSDISREVLREQPVNVCEFIANYLSALLITREHGVMAVKILEDLCDCRPSVSEHLMSCGMPGKEATVLSGIIKEEIESVQVAEGKEKVKETEILKKILKRNPLDEEMAAKVCLIARNAYRDYWYRKKMLEQNLKEQPDEPWEIAAQHTLEIYKKTKPSFTDLVRATQKIQAAYRGYHVRKQMLGHLKPKKKQAPKVDLHGPTIDIGESREINLGPVVDIKSKVKTDDMSKRFTDDDNKSLGLAYDTKKTITHVETPDPVTPDRERAPSRMISAKNMHTELYGAKEPEPAAKQPELKAPTPPAGGPRFTGIDELPAPPDDEGHKISFGPSKMIEPEIPEDLPDSTLPSGGATPTFDLDLSNQTASVPTSAATTAPTSDVEDMATSGTEEEEE